MLHHFIAVVVHFIVHVVLRVWDAWWWELLEEKKILVCSLTYFKEEGENMWINWWGPECSSKIESSWYPLYAHSYLHVQGAHSSRVSTWYVCRHGMCAPLLYVHMCIYLKVHFLALGLEGVWWRGNFQTEVSLPASPELQHCHSLPQYLYKICVQHNKISKTEGELQ